MKPGPSLEGTGMTVLRYNAVRCVLFVAFLATVATLVLFKL